MKKSILLSILFFLFLQFSYGQNCFPTGINLTNQTQIDTFLNANPNCTIIEGRLRVRVVDGNDLINLNSLLQITEVQGDLYLELSTSTSTVEQLEGLNSLTTIGGSLTILNSGSLKSLDGLQNLTSIGGGISIHQNENLESLSGLDNLKSIGGGISISSNRNLKNLTGLGGLEFLGGYLSVDLTESMEGFAPLDTLTGLSLEGCSIPSIAGLESVVHIKEDFFVVACNGLTDFAGLANLETIGGNFTIERVPGLTSFAMPNLVEIGGGLDLRDNESLQNFEGLENLQTVGSLGVSENRILENFQGLANLQTTGSLGITENPMLQSFEGLNALTTITGAINISNNPVLVNFDGFESLTTIGGAFEIINNDLLESITGWDMVEIDSTSSGAIEQNPRLSVCNAMGICNYLTRLMYSRSLFTL